MVGVYMITSFGTNICRDDIHRVYISIFAVG